MTILTEVNLLNENELIILNLFPNLITQTLVWIQEQSKVAQSKQSTKTAILLKLVKKPCSTKT